MYYIDANPSENGNYGNPQSNYAEGKLALPNDMLSAYIDTMGFATLTVENGAVISVERNEPAYQAYIDEHPPTPEPEPEPTAQEDTDAMLIDHELRISMLEMGVN